MVQLLPLALLVIALVSVAWSSWRSAREYAAFKTFADTRDRQRVYRNWLAEGFLLFGVGSVAILALLGDLGCLIHPPRPFFGLIRGVRAAVPLDTVGPAFLGGLTGGGAIAVVLIVLISLRRRDGQAPLTLGEIAPLMPRNGAETGWTALLSLNAGIGEELFFRLALPLLLALVTGDAALAFAVAVAIFGLAHLYQGWVGVLATTFLGALFAGLYLWTGVLAIPMAVHVFVDLMGLVVRPTLSRLAQQR